MPDNGRFSEEEIEQRLRDLGARMEYPPTPDVASTVRRKLDEGEQPQETRRTLRWPPFLAPRWTAVAAALVLVAVVALSPALRTTLSGLFVPQAGLETGGSAAKPESGGSEDRYRQEAGVASQAAGHPLRARRSRPALPRPSRPYRRGPPPERRFDSVATTSLPAATGQRPRATSRSSSGKTERPGSSRPSTPTAIWHSTPTCAYQRMPGRDALPCWHAPVPANAWRRAS